MNRMAIGFAAFSVLVACAVRAEDFTASICNAALGEIKDQYSLLSDEEQYDLFKDRMCSAKYDSYESFSQGSGKLGISVPVVEGIIGLNGSAEQKQSEFRVKYDLYCQSTYSQSDYKYRYQLQKQTVSAELARAWTKCIELYKDAYLQRFGTFISVSPVNGLETFAVRVTARNFENTPTVIKAIEPASSVRCYRQGELIHLGATKVDSVDFLLECKKELSSSVPLAIETNSGTSQVVRLPSAKNRFDELDSRIAELAGLSAQLREQLAKLEGEIVGHNVPRGTVVAWNPPAGSLTIDGQGNIVAINVPDGWLLCDGKFGTPDLKSRFIMGVDGPQELGQKGGATQHIHNMAIIQENIEKDHDYRRTYVNQGSTATADNLPPFVKLAYIMKQ